MMITKPRIPIPRYTLYFFFLFLSTGLHAQETIVTYVKKNGGPTAHKDSAAYTSILRLVANEEGLYGLNDYYPNGNLKRHGWVKAPDPARLRFEGMVETYYDNGERETVVHYADDRRIDTADTYYKSGILKMREVYMKPVDRQSGEFNTERHKRLVYYADSTGNVQVWDGNGQAEIIRNGTDVERGLYAGGLRQGRWEGVFRKGKNSFEEWYENGEVTRGITTDSLGKQYPYEKENIQPEYPKGIQKLRAFIGQNYRYPRKAIEARVKGQVVIGFVVDATGALTNFEVISDLGYGTAQEAIRLLKKAGPWSPGYQRGLPVRVKYTLPLRLDLSNSAGKKRNSP